MTSSISTTDLENLMTALEVEFVKLAECVVSPGWRLSVAASDVPGLHYNIAGHGRMFVGDGPEIPISPHTLVIIPAGSTFRIDAGTPDEYAARGTVETRSRQFPEGQIRRLFAGDHNPGIITICGYFRATYGTSVDLFGGLPTPIVEYFSEREQLDVTLKSALAELVAQEVGAGAISMILLKRVLIAILRRSVCDTEKWSERFSVFSDPKIARAFAIMVARPSAAHSVQSLAESAGLSRSTFMSRFREVLGCSPMSALRQLRMRRAHQLLTTGTLTVDQVAAAVGYLSRPAFYRAYRKTHGKMPEG